jgi:hypothetical protein
VWLKETKISKPTYRSRKLTHKQDTILKIGDFSTKTNIPPKTLASNISMLEPIQDNDNYKPNAKNCKNTSKIMIITSHRQRIIQIYPCLLKLSRKQDTILKIGDFSTKN